MSGYSNDVFSTWFGVVPYAGSGRRERLNNVNLVVVGEQDACFGVAGRVGGLCGVSRQWLDTFSTDFGASSGVAIWRLDLIGEVGGHEAISA